MVLPFLPNITNASDDPWIAFDYELQMYFETRNLLKHLSQNNPADVVNKITKNTVLESLIFHTRIMTDILISKGSRVDDIKLNDLLSEWCSSETGAMLIEKLKQAYGEQNKENSPCWVINKMFAHPTKWRTDRFNYSPSLYAIEPIIFDVLSEMEKVINRPILSYYITALKSRGD